jgi:ribonuclease HI
MGMTSKKAETSRTIEARGGGRRILVFTDGAARGNPGPGGWGAIVVRPGGEVIELGGRSAHTTNNKMELTAAIEALEALAEVDGEVDVYTDSTYLIRGIREWVRRWKRNGWKTAEGKGVLNRDLWERLHDLVLARDGAAAVAWHHVAGHSGVAGNERADAIATGLADEEAVDLYRGPLAAYAIEESELRRTAPSRRPPTVGRAAARRSSGPAHSYLSLVSGRPMRHSTWPECERRVKGVSGARFKKATSAEEERRILASWGYSPADLVE